VVEFVHIFAAVVEGVGDHLVLEAVVRKRAETVLEVQIDLVHIVAVAVVVVDRLVLEAVVRKLAGTVLEVQIDLVHIVVDVVVVVDRLVLEAVVCKLAGTVLEVQIDLVHIVVVVVVVVDHLARILRDPSIHDPAYDLKVRQVPPEELQVQRLDFERNS